MTLNNPEQIRQMYAEQKQYLTVVEIAAQLDMAHNTISRALSGEPVQPATVRKLAESLGLKATDIATFTPSR